MQVTKGTWRMRKQCVPGSLSSSPAQEPGNEASSSLVQRSFFCGDVIAITSWAPDVVNLVRPLSE